MPGTQQCVSVVPQLIDALVALTQSTLGASVEVLDGEGTSAELGNFLMVGIDDPYDDNLAEAATTQQDWANMGAAATRDETGTVTCAAVGWNGDSDPKAARDAAYGIAAGVAKTIAANRTLGLGDWLYQCQFGAQARFSQISDDNGCTALLVFDVAFAARIYPPT